MGLARTKGIAQIKCIKLTAGQSPASHPAAKPEWVESSFRTAVDLELTSGGEAAA